jgi:hypothetical protein
MGENASHGEGGDRGGISTEKTSSSFLTRRVDDAVRDDDIHRVIRQGDVLDFSLEKLDILRPGLALVLPRQRQHLVGHVESVGFARGADSFGGEQHVNATARPQIEYGLSGLQLGQCGGIAAAERCRYRLRRQARGLVVPIEVGSNRVCARRCATTARAATLGNL